MELSSEPPHPLPHAKSEPPGQLSTTELVSEILDRATLLVKKEIQLARTEIKNDLNAAIAMVKGFAVAAVAGVTTVNLLLVAVVFGLTSYFPGWLAALCLAGVTFVVAVIAGTIAWRLHVGRPLALTRKTLKEDVQWAKEELT